MVTAAGWHGQPAAVAAVARRHVHRPRPGPGAAAGRALRRPDDDGNDAFRAVSRYFDRITRPEQLLSTLPQVARVLTDPADCWPGGAGAAAGRAGRGVDFPAAMFATRAHRVPRPRRPPRLDEAAILRGARGRCCRRRRWRALLRRGTVAAGVRPGARGPGRRDPRRAHAVPHDHPLYGGALGIIGATSANTLAGEADVVLAVGTRLQDFTTASWTVFGSAATLIQVNAAASTPSSTPRSPWSATPGRPCRARRRARRLDGRPGLDGRAATERAAWDAHVDTLRAGVAPDGSLTYAQVLGVVNDASTPDDYVVVSSGGFPGRSTAAGGRCRTTPGCGRGARWTWSTASPAWGTRSPARGAPRWPGRDPPGRRGHHPARRRLLPDAQLRAVLGGLRRPPVRRGALRQRRLRGDPPAADRPGRGRVQQPAGRRRGPVRDAGLRVDFAAHAAALGCPSRTSRRTRPSRSSPPPTPGRRDRTSTRRPAVVVCRTHPSSWTEAGAWWEVGVPTGLSGRESLRGEQGRASPLARRAGLIGAGLTGLG